MSSVSDPVADFLSRLRNGGLASKREIVAPHSKMLQEVSRILSEEGFISGFEVQECDGKKALKVNLKYAAQRSVINGIRRESRPGLRRYVGVTQIPKVLSGVGISILSTSVGLLSSREARRRNVGGELLATVW